MKTTRTLAIFVLALGLVVGLPVDIAKADFTFGTPLIPMPKQKLLRFL
jgi:hypothetical protein